jgi:hypothetical protein
MINDRLDIDIYIYVWNIVSRRWFLELGPYDILAIARRRSTEYPMRLYREGAKVKAWLVEALLPDGLGVATGIVLGVTVVVPGSRHIVTDVSKFDRISSVYVSISISISISINLSLYPSFYHSLSLSMYHSLDHPIYRSINRSLYRSLDLLYIDYRYMPTIKVSRKNLSIYHSITLSFSHSL